jgi:hypothetical protein
MLLRLAVRPWGVCEAVGTTVGEAVGVSCDGVLAGVTVSETAGGAGDGEFVGGTVGEAVGDAVGPWARPPG